MVGKHARCLFKISETLYQIPGKELEADRLLKQAEDLYWKRVGKPELKDNAEYEIPLREVTEDDYDALVFLLWR